MGIDTHRPPLPWWLIVIQIRGYVSMLLSYISFQASQRESSSPSLHHRRFIIVIHIVVLSLCAVGSLSFFSFQKKKKSFVVLPGRFLNIALMNACCADCMMTCDRRRDCIVSLSFGIDAYQNDWNLSNRLKFIRTIESDQNDLNLGCIGIDRG
jgi:hypothetical protein